MNTSVPDKTLFNWLSWLESTRPEQDIELGLDRIRAVGSQLNLLTPAPFVITVAGTNGKGSTIALLEAILLKAGYKVGVFTSPHFIAFNERVRINGEQVSDESLCDAFSLINKGRGNTWLTYFEFATLAAVDCFQKANIDIALMEVGLGGRLDATNVVEPDVSIVTTVDLDHQDWLGYSIEAIGKEKAGIFRTGKPALYGDSPIPLSVLDQAIRKETPLFRRDHEYSLNRTLDSWSWRGVAADGDKIQLDHLPVPGLILDNAATALQALQFVPKKMSAEAIIEGLKSARLPGRYQELKLENEAHEPINILLDVAHNPQAAKQLANKLSSTPVAGKTRMIIAMYGDKDCSSVIESLSDTVDEWLVTEFESPRALAAATLCEVLVAHQQSYTQISTVKQALQKALKASSKKDRVVVAGSFITVAEVLTELQQL